jgi:hypothetical protein
MRAFVWGSAAVEARPIEIKRMEGTFEHHGPSKTLAL